MVAARKMDQESVEHKKYYNRTSSPKLHVVAEPDAFERMERKAQKASKRRVESLAQTATLVMACILIGAISVAGYERLTDISLKVDKVKKDIAKAEKRIDALDVQIACAVDITNVMDVAVDQLAMNYPQKDQIVELDGTSAQAPVREALAPSAETEYPEDGTVRVASADEDPNAAPDTAANQTSAPTESGVPAYAAAAVRITDEEVPTVSSTGNSLLAQPQ